MKQYEIVRIANENELPKSTIDKDWVLGHLLNAIFSLPEGKDLLVFKGGTCLRKCWFEDYRFSEDLDFTLLDKNFTITEKWVGNLLKLAKKNCTAKLYLEEFRYQVWNDIPQGYLLVIKFWGADHHPNQKPLPPARWQTQIHVDINFTEKLIETPEEKSIIHPYSDNVLITNKAISYSLNEILSEKIRSLR